jgi:hypothetical protein
MAICIEEYSWMWHCQPSNAHNLTYVDFDASLTMLLVHCYTGCSPFNSLFVTLFIHCFSAATHADR